MKPFLIAAVPPPEAWIWAASLLYLGIWGAGSDGHLTFCVPTLLGFDGCWGCGIGRSMGLALRGNFSASWAAHPFGIAGDGILLGRVLTLTFRSTNR
jgi:hypothetical protein